ncbi:uncharacterized protein LOC135368846 isoform X2 [Ornithodoros turicata]|uniref:uncharacterized protein LOC135368846 isoform X2 n=1 Tax=Ornithodoros turicata TaxID=34597 RepID=UPI0031392C97
MRHKAPMRQAKQTNYFDASSLIEFETLIDEPPTNVPRSISSWLNFKKGKLAFQEEALELEGNKGDVTTSPYDLKDDAEQSLIPDSTWMKESAYDWALSSNNGLTHLVRAEPGGLHCTPMLVRLSKRERLCSSPHSSLELEWENEVGLTPPQQCDSVTEDDFVYVPGADTSSNHSTPLSNENDLEWDGDLASVQISGFDPDTEQLISEIEHMTSEALKEPAAAVR